jgi:hypothetical protein
MFVAEMGGGRESQHLLHWLSLLYEDFTAEAVKSGTAETKPSVCHCTPYNENAAQ